MFMNTVFMLIRPKNLQVNERNTQSELVSRITADMMTGCRSVGYARAHENDT